MIATSSTMLDKSCKVNHDVDHHVANHVDDDDCAELGCGERKSLEAPIISCT